MAKKSINLPTSINAEEIRVLWYNIKNLTEIAVDLEDAILKKGDNADRRIPQSQQNILMFIKKFNQQIDQFHYNPHPKHIKVQKDWLHFLSQLISDFKAGKQTEEEAKAIIKKKCCYYFRTDDEDYKLIDDDYENNRINLSQYKKQLMEKITENEFRKDGPDEKYPFLVNKNFQNRDIDTFVNEAWAKRLKRDSPQGREDEAKFVLGQILEDSLSRKNNAPIYFHNEEHIDEYKVLTRLIKEFHVPFKNKILDELDKIQRDESIKKIDDGWS